MNKYKDITENQKGMTVVNIPYEPKPIFYNLADIAKEAENMPPPDYMGLIDFVKTCGMQVPYDGPVITEDIDYEIIDPKQLPTK